MINALDRNWRVGRTIGATECLVLLLLPHPLTTGCGGEIDE
jgi:hypothetical protein